MAQVRQSGAGSDSSAAVQAVVNGPLLVTLWGPDGIPIAVEEQYVAAKLAQGYGRFPAEEPKDLIEEFRLKMEAATRAVDAYWKGVESDGYVDSTDHAQKAAAEAAMEAAATAWGDFHTAVQVRYPVRSGDESPQEYQYQDSDGRSQKFVYSPQQVAMQRPDGQLFAVARTDVAMFEKMGYTTADTGRDVAAALAADAAAASPESTQEG